MIEEMAAPAGYVPLLAVAFGAGEASAVAVDAANPLPVATGRPARSTPLAGTLAASGSVGPFAPDLDRPIWLTLSGSWAGTASVRRSTDGGATRLPLTVGGAAWASFTGNANEPVGTESAAGATWYVDVVLTSGTLGYRIAQ